MGQEGGRGTSTVRENRSRLQTGSRARWRSSATASIGTEPIVVSPRGGPAPPSVPRPVSGCPGASDGYRSDGGAGSRAAPPRRRSDNDPCSSRRAPFAIPGRSQGELVFRNDADGGRTHAYMAPEEAP